MTGSSRIRQAVPHYSATSRRRAAAYDAASFEDVHASLLDLLPSPGAAVLDIGSGSGRDALALARRGYQVTAAEPSRALREHGRNRDTAEAVTWLDDRLPNLTKLTGGVERFDLILCSAVVMHLNRAELRPAFAAMASLLAGGGRLAISTRGEVPGDPPGLITTHGPRSLKAAARRAGLQPIQETRSTDSLGRTGLNWLSLIFEASAPEPHPEAG
jgi:SAM-dependent methyltransferase